MGVTVFNPHSRSVARVASPEVLSRNRRAQALPARLGESRRASTSLPTDQSRARRSPGKARAIFATWVTLVTAACGGSAPSAQGDAVTVGRRDLSASVLAVGAVKARIGAEVRVGSRISGRVRRLAANIGDAVRAGQVLAELATD